MKINIVLLLFILVQNKSIAQKKVYDSVVSNYANTKNFNGTVLLGYNGKIAYLKSIGIADRQLNVPITNNSKFKICSITKTFVALIFMQLYEEGKVKFNDTLGTFFSNYKGEARNKVTIHQLLTYSAGIPNCEHNNGLLVYQQLIDRDEFINKYCSDSLEFIPGSRFNYDNGTYIILGKIIENITGKSFNENLYSRILMPLNLKHTGIITDRTIIDGLIPSYTFDKSQNTFLNDPAYFIENYGTSGSMYSTVTDLLIFSNGIFNNKLIKQSTKTLMLSSYPQLYNVAYGFWVSEVELGKTKTIAADRQGAIMGSNTTWLHLIPENKTIIIFSNTNATNINQLRNDLATIFINQKN